MIAVRNLTRVFRTYKKQPGFWGGVKGLLKREYEETAAARDISFDIEEGEFVGFIGPNGAGKTTTLKMLSGLIYPTSGTARVAGFDPTKRENAYRRLFALVLGQKNQLWWDLPAQESFLLLRHIYGIPAQQYQSTLDELVDLLDVRAKLNVMVVKSMSSPLKPCSMVLMHGLCQLSKPMCKKPALGLKAWPMWPQPLQQRRASQPQPLDKPHQKHKPLPNPFWAASAKLFCWATQPLTTPMLLACSAWPSGLPTTQALLMATSQKQPTQWVRSGPKLNHSQAA
jgi:hypothetical protein